MSCPPGRTFLGTDQGEGTLHEQPIRAAEEHGCEPENIPMPKGENPKRKEMHGSVVPVARDLVCPPGGFC